MRRAARNREGGQVVILLALTILIILGMLSLALDGSYGLVREREDQNAADFASLAATQVLSSQCPGPSATPISEQDVYDVVNQVLAANDGGPAVWTADYLTASGSDLGIPVGSSTGPPAGAAVTPVVPPACGVSVKVHSDWNSFLSHVIGTNNLATGANAAATNLDKYAQGAAIDSMNPVYPHAVLAGGSGTFIVDGDIFLNSNPGCSAANPHCGTDVVDAKSSSNIYIYGNVDTVGPVNAAGDRPVDWCFQPPGALPFPGITAPYGSSVYSTGPPGNVPTYGPRYVNSVGVPTYPASPWPASNAVSCEINSSLDQSYPVIFAYDGIQNVPAPPSIDPLQATLGDPFASPALAACPFQGLNQYSTLAAASKVNGSTLVLQPGKYNFPVELGAGLPGITNIEFADCSGAYEDPATAAGKACAQPDPFVPIVSLCLQVPGTYLFDQGLLIDPSATQNVLGNNVMVGTNNPLPNALLPGNVPASGPANGDPCLPANVWGIPEGWNGNTSIPGSGNGYAKDWDQTTPCASPGLYQAIPHGGFGGCWCWGPGSHPPTATGAGTNDSLMIMGQGNVNLTPPQSENQGFADVLFYQNRNTPANWGFNAAPQSGVNLDSANITLGGVLYNASLQGLFNSDSIGFNTWDNGVPFYPGGTLQTGYGAGPPGLGWTPSAGSVKILGVAVVADFNTDGGGGINISGRQNPYKLPGGQQPPGLVG